MESPVPLLTVDSNGKFHLGLEASSMISKVKGKVGIIAIAGLYRTGKSYILNRLLNRQKGFEIGGTTNSCTKGIYTWGSPLKITNENGEQLNVILMDTEGIGSFERDQTHDAKIFSLSILLSSYFIYNSMGVIDESALEKISFIANLTKHIHVHSPAGNNEDERDLAPYFPQFMWLLRDFGLKLVDTDNNSITSSQYLENALGRPSKDKSKNEIRQVFQNVFPFRDCITLVRPVVDEEDLQNLDRIPEDSLREKFRTDVSIFSKKVLSKVRPKCLFGQAINGAAFVTLIKSYIEAINTGAVPTIKTTWESVSELENKKAVEIAIETYENLLDKKAKTFPIEEKDLYQEHLVAFSKAKEEFSERALGEQKSIYIEQLEGKIAEEYEKYIQKNDIASEKSSKELFTKIFCQIEESLKEEQFSSSTDLSHQWKKLVEAEYLTKAKGKFKFVVLSDSLLQKMSESIILFDENQKEKLKAQHAEEKEQLRSQLNEEKEDKKKLRNDFDEVKNDLRNQLEKTHSHIRTLEENNLSARKQIDELIQEKGRISAELEEKPKYDDVPKTTDEKAPKKRNCVIL